LTIRRRWFSAKCLFIAAFCLFWDTFMVVWFGAAFAKGEIAMMLYGSLHALVGITITYYTIACFVNHTDVTITPDFLSVKHAPIPFPGRKNIPVIDIRQLFTEKKIRRTKNGTTTSFRVCVILRDNSRQTLLGDLDDLVQARYFEQQIESVLGLKNAPVSGEMSG
jgi:hypothetical protein